MNGKILKVKQTNLDFSHDRFVNILGYFKYKTNGNIYIIYSDINTKYNVIYYGSGHTRQETILCMPNREITEEEIIKEYIYKVIEKQSLDNFEILPLENVDYLEIINSTKLEIKNEVLLELINIMIPKPEGKKEEPTKVKKKKKFPLLKLLLILLTVIIIGTSYSYLAKLTSKDKIEKSITCTKIYEHQELTATVEETNTYNFNINDELINIDTTMKYQFTETDYQDFILKGNYYKYIPNNSKWSKEDQNYNFTVTTNQKVDTSYNEPTTYEEVLSYYKANNYTCKEKIEDN